MAAQALIRRVPVGEKVVDAILSLVRGARPETAADEIVAKHVAWGPGPRASADAQRDARRPVDLARRAEALGANLPPLLAEAQRVAATVAQGVHGRRRVGQGDSFWQFRPFVTGDPSGRIDWRQSAKSSRAYIRETEWEAAQTVHLWRNTSASMHWRSSRQWPEKIARADLLLLALAALLLRGGERAALFGERAVAGRSGLDRL